MKKTAILSVFMLIPVLFFIVWAGRLYLQVEDGEKVRLAIQGYDPRSLLSGRYILYQIDWDKTDPDELNRLLFYCNVSVQKNCNSNTYDGKEHCWWSDYKWDNLVGRRQRFYIPEENANRLDRLFSGRKHLFEVTYSCQEGRRPVADELLIDGKPWREFLKENR